MRCFKGSKLHLSPSAFDQKGRSQSSFRQQRLLEQRLSLPQPERLQMTSNRARQQNMPKHLPPPKTLSLVISGHIPCTAEMKRSIAILDIDSIYDIVYIDVYYITSTR